MRSLHVSLKERCRTRGAAGESASLAEDQQRDANGGHKSDQQFHDRLLGR
ncbi:hypothetical protein L810_3713 [Burkholderia sp. AU4i]|nr:hypothetical protein L810_3713 [Burkholderia sp. AU4i]MDW9228423.1 hypothetical protein [Burkholderia cepacia]MDW9244283.1 hypothetical protein [Burkholderia cepacia]QOH33118.1 hypothetical protein C7S14_5529 [Burkholderia cepacia]